MSVARNLYLHMAATSFSYFAPLAILAPYLFTQGLSANEVGIILLTLSFGSKFFRIMASYLINKNALTKSLSMAYLFSGLGYFIIGMTNQFVLLLVATTLIGASYGLNFILLKTASLQIQSNGSLRILLSKTYIAANIPIILIPPVINVILFYFDGDMVFFTMGIALLICSGGSQLFMNFQDKMILSDLSIWEGLKITFKNKVLGSVFVFTFILWFFIAQLFSFLPILIGITLKKQEFLWLILFFNAGVILLFSFHVNKLLEKMSIDALNSLKICFSLIVFSSLMIFLYQSLTMALITVCIFSIAEIIGFPVLLLLISNNTSINQRVTILGINSLAAGLGEACGNYYWTMMENNFNYILIAIGVSAMLILAAFQICKMENRKPHKKIELKEQYSA